MLLVGRELTKRARNLNYLTLPTPRRRIEFKGYGFGAIPIGVIIPVGSSLIQTVLGFAAGSSAKKKAIKQAARVAINQYVEYGTDVLRTLGYREEYILGLTGLNRAILAHYMQGFDNLDGLVSSLFPYATFRKAITGWMTYNGLDPTRLIERAPILPAEQAHPMEADLRMREALYFLGYNKVDVDSLDKQVTLKLYDLMNRINKPGPPYQKQDYLWEVVDILDRMGFDPKVFFMPVSETTSVVPPTSVAPISAPIARIVSVIPGLEAVPKVYEEAPKPAYVPVSEVSREERVLPSEIPAAPVPAAGVPSEFLAAGFGSPLIIALLAGGALFMFMGSKVKRKRGE